MSEKALEAAARLKRFVESNDPDLIDDVYADGAVVWHSTDQVEVSAAELADLVGAIRRVAECEVSVRDFFPTEDGFVQTQKNTYKMEDGSKAEIHAALVVRVDDAGKIQRVDEYLDSAALAPLLSALEQG